MGSGQSSGDKGGSFSIDPSGNISHSKVKRQQKDNDHDLAYGGEAEVEVATKKDDSEQLSLEEADEILTRLKEKYILNARFDAK